MEIDNISPLYIMEMLLPYYCHTTAIRDLYSACEDSKWGPISQRVIDSMDEIAQKIMGTVKYRMGSGPDVIGYIKYFRIAHVYHPEWLYHGIHFLTSLLYIYIYN